MSRNKEIIYYENLHSKVHWRYTSIFEDDFQIIKLEDVWREECICLERRMYLLWSTNYENYFIYAYNKDYYKNKTIKRKYTKRRIIKIYKD